MPPSVASVCDNPSSAIMSEFPSYSMERSKLWGGGRFHIALTEDSQPFCVCMPRTTFVFRDKLKAKLDLLQSQNVSPSLLNGAIVVDKIRLYVDLTHLNRDHTHIYIRRMRLYLHRKAMCA